MLLIPLRNISKEKVERKKMIHISHLKNQNLLIINKQNKVANVSIASWRNLFELKRIKFFNLSSVYEYNFTEETKIQLK